MTSSILFLCITVKMSLLFFFFNDTATTEIYTLSLHDALPILEVSVAAILRAISPDLPMPETISRPVAFSRSEEHTSELQSQFHLVCRLLLEKKNLMPKSTRDRTSGRSSPTPSRSRRRPPDKTP